jgi:hypothetical protein
MAPYRPPPPMTLSCEGADRVQRDHDGRELARWPSAPACTRVACEGADWVRRDGWGREVERWVNASAQCPQPPRVRLTGDPSWRFGLSQR